MSAKLTAYCAMSSFSDLSDHLPDRQLPQSLFFPLDPFIYIVHESGRGFIRVFFSALYIPWFGCNLFFSFPRPVQASWPRFIQPAFLMCFCIVRMWYPLSLLWSLSGWGLALGNGVPVPGESVTLRSFIHTVGRASSSHFLTGS